MKAWTLAAAIAALITVGACQDAASDLAAGPDDDAATYITADKLAEELSADRLPRINWTKWYMDGQSETLFPLEHRIEEEIEAEYRQSGRLLPNGSRIPPGHAISTTYDRDMARARHRILQSLAPEPPEVTADPSDH